MNGPGWLRGRIAGQNRTFPPVEQAPTIRLPTIRLSELVIPELHAPLLTELVQDSAGFLALRYVGGSQIPFQSVQFLILSFIRVPKFAVLFRFPVPNDMTQAERVTGRGPGFGR